MTIRQKILCMPILALGLGLVLATPAMAQDAPADEHSGHHPAADATAPQGAAEQPSSGAASASPGAAMPQGMQGMMAMCPMMMDMMKQMMGSGQGMMMGQGRGMMGPGMMQHGMRGHGMMDDDMMGSDRGMMEHGMMGQGQGMMGQGMMGQGMMGRGMMQQDIGPAMIYGLPQSGQELTVEAVRDMLEKQLAAHANPRLKLGAIAADQSTVTAEIVTVDGSLVQKLAFDRYPGAVRQVQ